jgi:SRSO17 transposase
VGKHSAPGRQEKRFAAYVEGLAQAAGHADRATPLKMYCAGLLLPGERKSVEPMASRLAPDNVRRMHQSLHHVVADAPWSDEAVLAEVRSYALTAMRQELCTELQHLPWLHRGRPFSSQRRQVRAAILQAPAV